MNITAMDTVTNMSDKTDDNTLYRESLTVSVIKSALIIAIMLCTIVGNVISIAVIKTTRTMRTPSGNFIISLAMADLIVGACVLPVSVSAAVHGVWRFPDSVCRGIGFVQFYSTTLSISNLVVLTFDRWLSVNRAMRYKQWMTEKASYAIICLIWIAVFLVDFPMILPDVGGFYYMDGVYFCSPIWKTSLIYTFLLISVYLLPAFFIVLALNLKLFFLSRKHIEQMNSLQKQLNSADRNSSSLTRTTTKSKLVVLVVVLTFEISWMPYCIVELIKLFDATSVNNNVSFVVSWMGISNSFMNSIIYTSLNRKFRNGVKTLFKCTKQSIDMYFNKESLA